MINMGSSRPAKPTLCPIDVPRVSYVSELLFTNEEARETEPTAIQYMSECCRRMIICLFNGSWQLIATGNSRRVQHSNREERLVRGENGIAQILMDMA